MNLPPLMLRPRKKQHFASPLTGTMIHTEQFRAQPTPKGFLTTLYRPSPETDNHSKLYPIKTLHKLQKTALEEPTTARNTTHNSSHKMKPYYYTIDTVHTKEREQPFPKQLEIAQNSSHRFHYPNVQIIPLHLIKKYQDISKYRLVIHLQKYFRMYFAAHISHHSQQLNDTLSKYIPLMKQFGVLDQCIIKRKWPKQFWEIKNTQSLLTHIQKYNKNNDSSIKHILVLLQLYCIPDPCLRSTSLDNLILLTNKQLASKLQTTELQKELILLKADGTPIQDFLDIAFSTNKLYITQRTDPSSHAQAYQSFLEMVKRYHEDLRKKGFMDRLRNHFRKEIAPNKCDQDTINYHPEYPQYLKQRNKSLKKVMQILQQKKRKSKHKLTTLSASNDNPTSPTPRPKSKQSLWRQQNVQDSQIHLKTSSESFYYDFQLGNKTTQLETRSQFSKYHSLSKKINPQIPQNKIYLSVLEGHHPVISQLTKSKFHSLKFPIIFEVLIGQSIPEMHSVATMEWKNFAQLHLLCSKNIQSLIQFPDCHQVVRNFVQNYLEIKQEDYFRQELAAKLFRMLEGDRQSVAVMEEVVWSWLIQNGFVRHQALQRQLLWTYSARSRTFYQLILSMIFATFKTTPLDLAHQLLL